MKAQKLLALGVIGALAFGTLAPQAQTGTQKIGFVDVQAAVKAHPGFAAIDTLNKQAEAELKPTATQIQTIQQKGQNATAADRQQLETLSKTYQTNAAKWDKQIGDKTKPVIDEVNKAVGATAQAQGVSMVFDKAIAATSGLVIYADEKALDLTTAVVNRIKK